MPNSGDKEELDAAKLLMESLIVEEDHNKFLRRIRDRIDRSLSYCSLKYYKDLIFYLFKFINDDFQVISDNKVKLLIIGLGLRFLRLKFVTSICLSKEMYMLVKELFLLCLMQP